MREIYIINMNCDSEHETIAAFTNYDPIPRAIENWLEYAEDYMELEWENEYRCHTSEHEFIIDLIPLYDAES